jgi:hypothetical protein
MIFKFFFLRYQNLIFCTTQYVASLIELQNTAQKR